MMFNAAPGKEGNQLVPDLAEGPGKASGDAKTWTYKLRKGVKFDDGTEVTSADVKYAVLRSTDKQTFPNGPAYWEGLLDLPKGYKGPYKTPNMNTDSAIETPDKYTIVFHAKAPFAAFDYLAQQPDTMPVPKDKDTGAKYRNSIVSTGPYKFEGLQPGKSFNLVRNDQWDPATDPNRKALPDRIEVTLNVNADDIDNRLISGDLDVDVAALGVQPAAQSRVLQDPALKDTADNPLSARNWYTSINPTVPPLDNIECRKADRLRVGIWQPHSCRPTFQATQISISTRTVQITKATLTRPRNHSKPAGNRTASRPTSPTAQSGRRRKPPPRRSSRRWVELASSSP
jgi:peptide/nickel transport system substrate-binding protein